MKHLKKIVCVTLVLLMLFTMTAFAAESKKLNYVVLGDSIGWGAGVLNSTEACFGRIVADTNDFNLKNDAVNGYTSQRLIRHLEKKNIAEDVRNADIISLSIGGNNFLLNDMKSLIADAAEGKYERFDSIADSFYIDFCTIIGKIKELNPDALILAQTLYNPGTEEVREAYQQGINRLNNGYRKYLVENPGAYELLEVGDAFLGHPEFIARDNIHPSADGNIVIAKLVLQKLADLGISDKTEPVIKNEGIEQSEFMTMKFFKYLVKVLFERLKVLISNLVKVF